MGIIILQEVSIRHSSRIMAGTVGAEGTYDYYRGD